MIETIQTPRTKNAPRQQSEIFSLAGLKVGRKSVTGKRKKGNDDSMGDFLVEYDEVNAYVADVTDGVSSTLGGGHASQVAVKKIQIALNRRVNRQKTTIPVWLESAIVEANHEILFQAQEHPEWGEMSTTVVMVALVEGKLYVMHLGDSRAYLIRKEQGDGIHLLTSDHTAMQRLVDAKKITADESVPQSNRAPIERFLGVRTNIADDLRQRLDVDRSLIHPETGRREESLELQPGDSILLCTDGLHNRVTSEEIKNIVLAYKGDPETAVEALVNKALEKGERDDITVVLLDLPIAEPELGIPSADKAAIETRTKPQPHHPASWLIWGRVMIALTTILLLVVMAGGLTQISKLIFGGNGASFPHSTTRSPEPSVAAAASIASTLTATFTPTPIPTATATTTETPTMSLTMAAPATELVIMPVSTIEISPSKILSATTQLLVATEQPTDYPTHTPTDRPTATSTDTPTPTRTSTPTQTATPKPTHTPSSTPWPTPTPTLESFTISIEGPANGTVFNPDDVSKITLSFTLKFPKGLADNPNKSVEVVVVPVRDDVSDQENLEKGGKGIEDTEYTKGHRIIPGANAPELPVAITHNISSLDDGKYLFGMLLVDIPWNDQTRILVSDVGRFEIRRGGSNEGGNNGGNTGGNNQPECPTGFKWNPKTGQCELG